jgi:hypothetical protein
LKESGRASSFAGEDERNVSIVSVEIRREGEERKTWSLKGRGIAAGSRRVFPEMLTPEESS